MRYQEPEKRTYYARDIFRNLCSVRPALAKLKGRGEKSDALIDVLLAVGEGQQYPTYPKSKELQQILGLTPGKLKSLIDDLHGAFLERILEDATLLQFPLVEHQFYVQGYKESVTFNCLLPVTPRIGEELVLPFVGVIISSRCYVTDVKYMLEDAKVCVEVWARVGEYNQHREYLRAQAEFEKRINWDNKFEPDYATEKKLKEIYPDSSASYSYSPAPSKPFRRRYP